MNVVRTIQGVRYLFSRKRAVPNRGIASGNRMGDLAAGRVITCGIHGGEVNGKWCDVAPI